jgi:hypothetical protein
VKAEGNIAEIFVLRHPTDPRRKLRRAVDCHCEPVTLGGDDVHKIGAILAPQIRHSGFLIENGADQNHRVGQHVDTPRRHRGRADTGRATVGSDIESNFPSSACTATFRPR